MDAPAAAVEPVLSPAQRLFPLALAGAAIVHAAALLLVGMLPQRLPPEDVRVAYDLVFIEPAPAPAPAASEPSPQPLAPAEPTAIIPQRVEEPATLPPKPRPRPMTKTAAPAPDRAASSAEASHDGPPSPPAASSVAAAPSAVAAAPAPARALIDPAYAATLLDWLRQHKEYPWLARRRGVEGRVVLVMEVARNGRVAEVKVETSSGAAILDQAAVSMVHRADPLPPVPASIAGDVLELRVPVDFALER